MTEIPGRELMAALRDVGDEKVYRSMGGAVMRQVRGGQTRRCDRAVRELLARGLVREPPEGASFFELTDVGGAVLQAVAASVRG